MTEVLGTRPHSDTTRSSCCVWLTGLSGAGKTTIATLVHASLRASGRPAFILDGDRLRRGLNRDLGFTDADRAENIRRVAEVARLMVDAGVVTIVAAISPFRAGRRQARELFEAAEFLEVYVDASLAVCEARDPKGLYKKARADLIANFTGITSPYEPPNDPDVRVDAGRATPEACAALVLGALAGRLGGVTYPDARN